LADFGIGGTGTAIATGSPFRGDVYLASLDPAKGSEQAGTRPVVIVSRDSINQNSPVVVVVPVSDRSNFKKIYPSQVILKRGVGGLTMDSVVMCDQVRAITVDRLNTYLGRLDYEHIQAIEAALKNVFDFD